MSGGGRRMVLLALACAYVALAPFAATHLDLARDMFVAERMLRGEEFPSRGPILAAAVHLGPVWYWLLALLLEIGRSWLGAVIALALVGAAQFPLAYLLGKEQQSRRAGLLWAAGLLLPSWSTFESLLPLHYQLTAALVLGFALCACRYWRLPRRRYLVGATLLLCLAVHAHPSNIGLAWIWIALLARGLATRRLELADLLLALFISALPLVPYAIWNAQHGFADFRDSLSYLGGGSTGALSRAVPVLWAAALGGARYWFATMLALPAWTVSAVCFVIAGLGLLGVCALAAGARQIPGRRALLFVAYAAAAILLTTALIRNESPFYMTTALHVILVGAVALGLDRSGASAPAAAARALFTAVSLLAFGAAGIGFARLQINGSWPFSFFPLYDVTAASVPEQPLSLMPAYAMAASGRFLCAQTAPVVHGALARHLLYDYAIEMRLRCGRSDVGIGGNEAGRAHWLGLSRAMLSELGAQPTAYIGPLGLLPADPVSHAPAISEPATPIYPSYSPAAQERARHAEYQIALSANERIAIANVAFFTADPQVTVTIGGHAIEARATDAVTRVYACAGCSETGKTPVSIDVESADLPDVDIVVF